MKKNFKKTISSLEKIAEFVAEFVGRNEIGETTTYSLNLLIEEIFTNMVKYGSGSMNDISLCLKISEGEIILKMIDYNVDPFDVTETAKVDINMPLSERKPGGLGLHLVKTLADEISYQHTNGNSIIIIKKKLEENDV